MYGHLLIQFVIVAVKVSCHYSVIIVFNMKNITLESINDSVFSFSYIFDVASVAF